MTYFGNVLKADVDKYKLVRSKHVLKLDTELSVREQFGWIPTSVLKPERGKEWRQSINDSGDSTVKTKVWSKKSAVGGGHIKASEFNPHLASTVIKYWSEQGDLIVDPFAGRATRGVVALSLDRQYSGYEIASRTFRETVKKITDLGGHLYNLDGCWLQYVKDESADFVFTCPPYHQVEQYESVDGQLSDIKDYGDFLQRISVCVKNIKRVLKSGKFVCWVCGDWRAKGKLVPFHADCIKIFQDAGLELYDIVVIHNNSLFVFAAVSRAAAKRITCKVHEYLLVFRKPSNCQ